MFWQYKEPGISNHGADLVLSKYSILSIRMVNSSPPGQNGGHFADGIFRCIFLNEKLCILIQISLKIVPKGSVDNNPALA